jgi:hypothetical protein
MPYLKPTLYLLTLLVRLVSTQWSRALAVSGWLALRMHLEMVAWARARVYAWIVRLEGQHTDLWTSRSYWPAVMALRDRRRVLEVAWCRVRWLLVESMR